MNKNRINTVWKSFNTLLHQGYPEHKIDLDRMMLNWDRLVREKRPHSSGDIAFTEAMNIIEESI